MKKEQETEDFKPIIIGGKTNELEREIHFKWRDQILLFVETKNDQKEEESEQKFDTQVSLFKSDSSAERLEEIDPEHALILMMFILIGQEQ